MVGLLRFHVRILSLRGLTWREVPAIILLTLSALWVFQWYEQYQRDHAPIEEYFEVKQLGVPSHTVGDNPVIAYDRVIHRPFTANWIGEVQRLDDLQSACKGSGRWRYETETKMPKEGFTLDWFMDRHCNLPAGFYRLQSCWKIERDQAQTVELCRVTDPFRVWDPKELTKEE